MRRDNSRPPAGSQVRLPTMAVVLGSLAAALLLAAAILALRRMLVWLFVAALLAMIASPAVDHLAQRIKRWQAVGLLGGAAAAVAVGATVVLVPRLFGQLADLIRAAPALLSAARDSRLLQELDERFRVVERVENELGALLGRAPDIASGIAALARTTATGLAALMSIFFATLFMLQSGPALVNGLLGLLPFPARISIERIGPRIAAAVRRYSVGMLIISAAAGFVAMVSLRMAGVPYFLPVAAAVAVLGFIPFIGAVASTLLLGGITWATVGFTRALIVVVVFQVYNQIENNVWQPLVHHRTVRLSPLAVLVAMLAGAQLAGLLGLVLAVPIGGVVQIVFREVLAVRRERLLLTGPSWPRDDNRR